MNMKISLTRHCIETEIRRQYNRAISEYFKADTDERRKTLESRIDLMHHALETLDFNFLRNRYPELRGEADADVRLVAGADRPRITINGEEIETTDSD